MHVFVPCANHGQLYYKKRASDRDVQSFSATLYRENLFAKLFMRLFVGQRSAHFYYRADALSFVAYNWKGKVSLRS